MFFSYKDLILYLYIEIFKNMRNLINKFLQIIQIFFVNLFYPHSVKINDLTLNEIEDISNWLTDLFGKHWRNAVMHIITNTEPSKYKDTYNVYLYFKNKYAFTQFKLTFSDLIVKDVI